MARSKEKTSSGKRRENLSIRLQPYSDDPLAEVANWLNELPTREANRLIEQALVTCYLAYARRDSGDYSDPEIRETCLRSSDALQKHDYVMRQAFNVSAPPWASGQLSSSEKNREETSPPPSKPKGHLKGKTSSGFSRSVLEAKALPITTPGGR